MRYRKVDPRIWNDAKFSALSERAKLVFLYVLTHPNLTMLGAMRASIPGLAAELGMDAKAFREAFAEGCGKGLVLHDEQASFTSLPRFLKYNRPESPNVVRAWPEAFDLLPECPLKDAFFRELSSFACSLTEGFAQAFTEVFAKTIANQEQEQEQEQESKDTSPSALAGKPAESLSAKDPPRRKDDHHPEKAAIERLFDFYCTTLGRNPNRYTLTPARRDKAVARLRERCKANGGDLAAAERDLGQAIENLAAADWNRENGYIDWTAQIFRSAEEFERRLNWTKPIGESSGNSHHESHNERTLRKALAELDGQPPNQTGGHAPRQSA